MTNQAEVKNINEVLWEEFPDHYGGALRSCYSAPKTALPGISTIGYRPTRERPTLRVISTMSKSRFIMSSTAKA